VLLYSRNGRDDGTEKWITDIHLSAPWSRLKTSVRQSAERLLYNSAQEAMDVVDAKLSLMLNVICNIGFNNETV